MAVKITGSPADSTGVHRARIHCVDVTTHELIYSWMVEIESDKPLVSRAYQIQTTKGVPTPHKFQFANPLNEFVMLEFVSSKPALMEVRRQNQGFEAHESRPVELLIPPQMKGGQVEEVILHINDQMGKVTESLMFKILVKE